MSPDGPVETLMSTSPVLSTAARLVSANVEGINVYAESCSKRDLIVSLCTSSSD